MLDDLKLDELTLEEKMFVMGFRLDHLPEEPKILIRGAYNLGLDLYKIWNYLSLNNKKEIDESVRCFKEAIDLTQKGELGDIEGSFPPHDEWLEETYNLTIKPEIDKCEEYLKKMDEIVNTKILKDKNLKGQVKGMFQTTKTLYDIIMRSLSEATSVWDKYKNLNKKKE